MGQCFPGLLGPSENPTLKDVRIMAQVFVVVAAGSVIGFIVRDLGDGAIAGWIIQVLSALCPPPISNLSDVIFPGSTVDAKRPFTNYWSIIRCSRQKVPRHDSTYDLLCWSGHFSESHFHDDVDWGRDLGWNDSLNNLYRSSYSIRGSASQVPSARQWVRISWRCSRRPVSGFQVCTVESLYIKENMY